MITVRNLLFSVLIILCILLGISLEKIFNINFIYNRGIDSIILILLCIVIVIVYYNKVDKRV